MDAVWNVVMEVVGYVGNNGLGEGFGEKNSCYQP